MKRCSTCKQEKDLENFGWKNKEKTQLRSCCRECMKAYIKSHYYKNVPYYIEKARRQEKIYRQTTCQKIYDYLLAHPCIDCGESDPIVLEFDHLATENKLAEVSRMVRDQRPWRIVFEEIKKCEVRCANCHRRKTAKEQNWSMYLLSQQLAT